MTSTADSLLDFWFAGADLDSATAVAERLETWFAFDPAFDGQIRARFHALPDLALQGKLDAWAESARSCVALVIVLDQLPRNLYRGSTRAFAYDADALDRARAALERGLDRQVHPMEAFFFYMPFQHAEDPAAQAHSVALFRAAAEHAPPALRGACDYAVDYALRHQGIIERFGRFPHRNAMLGRPSTPEELEFLASGGDTFSRRRDGSGHAGGG